MRLATLHPLWAASGPRRKPFELTTWRPGVVPGMVILTGPSGRGMGRHLKHVWAASNPGPQWSAEAQYVLGGLQAKGLLNALDGDEIDQLKQFLSQFSTSSTVWVTELLNPVDVRFELSDLIDNMRVDRNLLPRTSQGWPYLHKEVADAVLQHLHLN